MPNFQRLPCVTEILHRRTREVVDGAADLFLVQRATVVRPSSVGNQRAAAGDPLGGQGMGVLEAGDLEGGGGHAQLGRQLLCGLQRTQPRLVQRELQERRLTGGLATRAPTAAARLLPISHHLGTFFQSNVSKIRLFLVKTRLKHGRMIGHT